jgi:alanine racemase
MNTVIAFLKRKEHVFFKDFVPIMQVPRIIANYYRVDKQIKRFEDIYQYLCKNELKPEISIQPVQQHQYHVS